LNGIPKNYCFVIVQSNTCTNQREQSEHRSTFWQYRGWDTTIVKLSLTPYRPTREVTESREGQRIEKQMEPAQVYCATNRQNRSVELIRLLNNYQLEQRNSG